MALVSSDWRFLVSSRSITYARSGKEAEGPRLESADGATGFKRPINEPKYDDKDRKTDSLPGATCVLLLTIRSELSPSASSWWSSERGPMPGFSGENGRANVFGLPVDESKCDEGPPADSLPKFVCVPIYLLRTGLFTL